MARGMAGIVYLTLIQHGSRCHRKSKKKQLTMIKETETKKKEKEIWIELVTLPEICSKKVSIVSAVVVLS
jgi:hypothetical protein